MPRKKAIHFDVLPYFKHKLSHAALLCSARGAWFFLLPTGAVCVFLIALAQECSVHYQIHSFTHKLSIFGIFAFGGEIMSIKTDKAHLYTKFSSASTCRLVAPIFDLFRHRFNKLLALNGNKSLYKTFFVLSHLDTRTNRLVKLMIARVGVFKLRHYCTTLCSYLLLKCESIRHSECLAIETWYF